MLKKIFVYGKNKCSAGRAAPAAILLHWPIPVSHQWPHSTATIKHKATLTTPLPTPHNHFSSSSVLFTSTSSGSSTSAGSTATYTLSGSFISFAVTSGTLSFLKELQHGGLTCFLLKFFHHFNVAEESVHHPSCYCAASFSIRIIVFYHGKSFVYFPQCFT